MITLPTHARRSRFGLALLALVAAQGCAAASPDAAVIARQGNGKGALACATCHGVDGGGQAAAGFPRLAGLDAAYLERQLDSYADGTRSGPVMAPMANALTQDERHALAGYYSRLSVPTAAANGAPTPNGDALGQELATRGRWSKQVPACIACHGPQGVGVGAGFPPLAGQPATYIANQLRDWQAGTRKNDPLDMMRRISLALDAPDITAVSEWFAAQPAVLKGERP